MSPGYRSRMQSLKVTAIRRYATKEHVDEYFIVEVSVPDLGRPRYVRIERDRKRCSYMESPICDFVSTMEAWPTSHVCIDKLDCRNTSKILLDLAVVATLVDDRFKRQGFWYSDLMVAVLQQSFSGIQGFRRHASVEADHAQDAEMDILDELSGTFKKVRTHSILRTSVIKEILETFATHRLQIFSLRSCFFWRWVYFC
jgi:hypothetical protein